MPTTRTAIQTTPGRSPRDAPDTVGETGISVAVVAAGRKRTSLRASLEADGLRVVAVAASPAELRGLPAPPEVVVVLPDRCLDPVESVRAVRRHAHGARLVLVAPDITLRALRDLMAEEVDTVVLERDAPRALALAVRSATAGQLSLPASVRPGLARPALSAREKQVLGMVVLGMRNGEIAGALHLSESTVKSHLASSYAKLGVRTRSEAAQLILDPASGLGSGILTIDGSD